MEIVRKNDASVVYSEAGAEGRSYFTSGGFGVVRILLEPGREIADHAAPFDAYFFVVEGACEFREEGSIALLEPGDCLRSGRGTVHGMRNPGKIPLVVAVFKVG